MVSVCTCGRAGWMAGVGKRGRDSPLSALAPPPTTQIRAYAHRPHRISSLHHSTVPVSQPQGKGFFLSPGHLEKPFSWGFHGHHHHPPPLSETPGHIPAWPTSFQHPGPTTDAISLKKPLLTNCLLRVQKLIQRQGICASHFFGTWCLEHSEAMK